MGAGENLEEEGAEGPYISLEPVLVPVDQLWCHCQRCSSECFAQFVPLSQWLGQAHVSEFELVARYVSF